MEHCLGDLHSFIKMYPVFSSSEAYSLDLITCICAAVLCALKHLNNLGFIHGDIKPENILISQDLVPKLCDFGTTQKWRDSYTPGTVRLDFGTLSYMPEELNITGKYFFDENLDSFALGMTMVYLLVYKYPFHHSDHRKWIQGMIHAEKDVKDLFLPEFSMKREQHTYPDDTVAHPRLWGGFVYAIHHMLTSMDYRKTPSELCKVEFFAEMATAWDLFQRNRGVNVLSATMDLSPTILTPGSGGSIGDSRRLYDFPLAHIVHLTVKLQENLLLSFPDSIERNRQELEFLVTDIHASTNVNHRIDSTQEVSTRLLLRGICFFCCMFEEYGTPLLTTLCLVWMASIAKVKQDDLILLTGLLVLKKGMNFPKDVLSSNSVISRMEEFLRPRESQEIESFITSIGRERSLIYVYRSISLFYKDKRGERRYLSNDPSMSRWRHHNCIPMVLRAIDAEFH